MTLAWQNGQYFRQEHTQADADARRSFIGEQILKIEQACEVIPGSAPGSPSKVASLLTETFGSHVLDPANIAKDGYVLVSEDMYFRQVAEAAVGGEGVWLQPVLAFARDMGIITHEQLADSSVRLAWRRHSHVAAWSTKTIDPGDRQRFAEIVETELTSLHEGNFARYRVRPSEFAAWRQVWEAK